MTTESKWSIDVKPALAALKKLRDSIGKTDKKAAEGFDRSAKASKQARDEMGRFVKGGAKGALSLSAALGPAGVAGIVLGLVAAFAQLTKVAVGALADVTKEAIGLNAEAEGTRIALVNIFEGNEKAADAFIDTMGELSVKLGTSRQQLTGFGKGLLPDVGTIDGTTALLENVITISKDAGAHIDDVRRTTEAAVAGDFQGFQDVLNLPLETTRKMRELGEEIGNAAAITQVLGDRIQAQGLSVASFADTLDTLQNKVNAQIENYKILLGVSPFDEMKEQTKSLLETLDANQEQLGFVAGALGDLSTNVIEFVGSGLNDFIADLDFRAIEVLVDEFNELLSVAELVVDILFDLPSADEGIRSTTIAISQMKEGLLEIAKHAKIARDALKIAFLLAKATFQIQQGDVSGAFETGQELLDMASAEAQAENIANVEDAFADYEQRQSSLDDAQKQRIESTKKGTAADKAAGEAVLKRKKDLEELEAAQVDAAKAAEEISKKEAEAAEASQKKITSIMRKEADKRFDDAVKASQAREDIARKNAQSIEDIFRKQGETIEAASVDLTREEQDIARDGARDRRQIEVDAATQRVDIERNFRTELRRIQDQFNNDAAEAERNNDAQAFVKAVRSRDDQIKVATEDKDTTVEESAINAERQREALAVQLAGEIEDARIANAQKIEDLNLRLQQELEAQALKNEREIEAQSIKEARLKEKRDLDLQRQLEDFARTEAEKTAKLQESLSAQLETIAAAKKLEVEATAKAEAEKTAIVQKEVARRASILAEREALQEQAGEGALPLAPTRGDRGFGDRFAAGGRPPVGQPVTVGERGPEVFLPDQAGTIIPNNMLFSPPAQPGIGGASSMTTNNNSPTFNLAEGMFQDPVARRQLTNFVLGVLAEGV